MTPQSLAELVAARRAELGISYRTAAERSKGLVSHSALAEIEADARRQVTDRVIEGIAVALDVPVSKVRRAAGLSARELPPFTIPDRASRLNARERKLVLNLIDTLLEAHQDLS